MNQSELRFLLLHQCLSYNHQVKHTQQKYLNKIMSGYIVTLKTSV